MAHETPAQGGTDEAGSRLARLSPWLLFLCVCVAYSPSFGAGFLNYDDPWLIAENPRFAPGAWDTLWAAFFDFTRRGRMSLGAEYLPLRDVLVWAQGQLFARAPQPMHVLSVVLFGWSVLLFRRALARTWGSSLRTEAAAWLFALHPLHVESVGWLAGQKDVLALLFIAAALAVHAGERRRARWLVPLLVLSACLSKSMSVAVIVLLAATDFAKRRRPDLARYALCLLAIGASLALHLYVGRVVHMLAAPLGGSRLNALYSMGPVWLRYLALCVRPDLLSIEHVVPPLTELTLLSATGYALLVAWLVLGVWRARSEPWVLYAWAWFLGPLLPVSQVLAPLQNRMADRYLWLSVMAPIVLFTFALERLCLPRLSPLVPRACVAVLALFSVVATFDRAVIFSDSVLLFADGAQHDDSGPRTSYQLGKALEALGRSEQAIVAFRETLRRAPEGQISEARRATNNLAKLLAARGELLEAERVLRAGYARFPDDPKIRGNLVKVLEGLGRSAEAEQVPPPLRSQADLSEESFGS